MIVLVYIFATLISVFFFGALAPLVGIAVGFFVHIIVLLSKISKTLNDLSNKLGD
ncbi:hypothetical protein KO561_00085 [Radiobacillus kanasensis]|uniref:hypothetical protein n=1 Tax=Radiobacillus kanasensis TaxID=2844358 RepID=UPI001E3B7B08|nr:hypothetical protein [Radiobacillus kanasensis]UFT99443.1 hypothetical protein KO561_00085 [Radiobacillus kanasensis]